METNFDFKKAIFSKSAFIFPINEERDVTVLFGLDVFHKITRKNVNLANLG